MPTRRTSGGKTGPRLTPRALSRLTRTPKGYRDPGTGTRYTVGQVRAAKVAAGVTPTITKALKKQGYGGSFTAQVRAAQKWVDAQPAKVRKGASSLSAVLTLAIREDLGALRDSFARAQRQQGKQVTRDQVMRSRTFWGAIKDLGGPRESVQGGTARKVGPQSKRARALEVLGLRPPGATWRVGESPTPERVALLLDRPVSDLKPTPRSSIYDHMTPEEMGILDDAIRAGTLPPAPKRVKKETREDQILKIIGTRAPNDPRRNER